MQHYSVGPLVGRSQVMREVRGFLHVQLDHSDPEGLAEYEKAALVAARQRQQSCIRRFLDQEDGSCVASVTVYRTATFRWLQALHHAVEQVTGFRWEQFASGGAEIVYLEEEVQVSLAKLFTGSPRTGIVVADQHSCGPCATSFLQSAGNQLLVDLAFDPHRFWNFEKMGLA